LPAPQVLSLFCSARPASVRTAQHLHLIPFIIAINSSFLPVKPRPKMAIRSGVYSSSILFFSPWPETASERHLSTKLMPNSVDRGCHMVSVTGPYGRNMFSRLELLLFLQSSSSIVLTRLSGPRSRPTTPQEIWQRRESNPDLWICSQEL
jgi:hypothetical protein